MSLRIRSVLDLPQSVRDSVRTRLAVVKPTAPAARDLRLAELREERERHVCALLFQLSTVKLSYLFVREYRFDPERGWRLDLFAPTHRLAIECHGATSEFNRGRHLRGGPQGGFARDREKMNAAVEAGIRVLEYCAPAIADGSALAQIQRIMTAR
jgi:hypothetical protein